MTLLQSKTAVIREVNKKIIKLALEGFTNDEISLFTGEKTSKIIKYLSSKGISSNRYRKIEQTLIEKQVIIGSLLGDGTIEFAGKYAKSARLRIKHSNKQELYLKHKHNLLCRLVKDIAIIPEREVTFPDGHTVVSKGVEFKTISHPIFSKYHNNWYKEGIKIIGKEAFELDELGLAIWFMDDGYSSNYEYFFCTNCFEKYEIENFISYLKEKFKINFQISLRSKQYLIRVPSEDRFKFRFLIEPYIIQEMKYKLK